MSKRTSVLIVEDEGVVAEDLQQTLSEFGYDAYAVAVSADEAIMRASERCPDVVLMDIRIKGERDGIEAAALMRDQFGVPVVFLTAHTDAATIQRAKSSAPYGYLTKPVRTAELRSVIEIAILRSEMERRLRERERWFSTTLHSIADAVITVDLAGNLTFMNTEAEHLIGLRASDVMGRPSRDVLKLIDDQQRHVDSPLERAIRDGKTSEVAETCLVNVATGIVRPVSDSVAPVVDEGRTLGAVMVFRDITNQKRIQRQLELADRLASLGTMAAGVAHEVNNPLTVVVSNTEFVKGELASLRARLESSGIALPSDVLDCLTTIDGALDDVDSASTRIGRIVSDLRSFARPESTSTGRAVITNALQWALRSTANELRLRARVVADVHAVPDVIGDEVRLGQVFVNLLVNAAQAIAPGAVEVNEVHITARLESPERVVIELRDTGQGMSPAVLQRAFEPFFTTKTVGVGTGLGLSISHGIVSSMGGELTVESELGKGTTVRVVLRVAPLAAPLAAPVGRPIAPTPVQSERRARVLAIDDEPMVLQAIKRMLRNHDVVAVSSAADALAMLDEGHAFDVIFSDLMMPNMTGIELYEELLKRSPDLARTVVFITGGAITTRTEDFLESIANQWIEKPFAAATLQAAVTQRLHKGT